jgi:hypothetical protein
MRAGFTCQTTTAGVLRSRNKHPLPVLVQLKP